MEFDQARLGEYPQMEFWCPALWTMISSNLPITDDLYNEINVFVNFKVTVEFRGT